jgi:hypothetical protein
MSAGDYGLIVGLFLAAFSAGWVTGLLFKSVRRVIEIAAGGGS